MRTTPTPTPRRARPAAAGATGEELTQDSADVALENVDTLLSNLDKEESAAVEGLAAQPAQPRLSAEDEELLAGDGVLIDDDGLLDDDQLLEDENVLIDDDDDAFA